jgi:hypothetical protein
MRNREMPRYKWDLKVREMHGNVISKSLNHRTRSLAALNTMRGRYKRIASGLICNALNEGSRLPVGYDSRLSARPGVRPLIFVPIMTAHNLWARRAGRSGRISTFQDFSVSQHFRRAILKSCSTSPARFRVQSATHRSCARVCPWHRRQTCHVPATPCPHLSCCQAGRDCPCRATRLMTILVLPLGLPLLVPTRSHNRWS